LPLFAGRIAEAREALLSALEVARSAGDRGSEGMLLGFLGMVCREEDRPGEAHAYLEESLTILRELGDRRYEGIHTGNLAGVLFSEGKFDEALKMYEQSIAILREASDERMVALAQGNLGFLLQGLGKFDAAREQLEQALATHTRVGDRRVVGAFLGFLAALDHERGALAEARARYRASLELLSAASDDLNHARTLACAAALEAELDEIEAAEAAFARLEVAVAKLGHPGVAQVVAVHRGHLDLALARLAERGGDAEEGGRLRNLARTRAELSTKHPSDELQLALRLLRRAAEAPPDSAPRSVRRDALVVHAEGAWFRSPGGQPVDLRLRRAARLLLLTLVRARLRAPGKPLGLDELLQGGWPGERLLPHAGASRVHTMLTTLRNLGLRELILTRREGHCLDPAVEVVLEGASAAGASERGLHG
jgi:tetratricopeptide (TPR) repeat protein